jgi:hypothetical protein
MTPMNSYKNALKIHMNEFLWYVLKNVPIQTSAAVMCSNMKKLFLSMINTSKYDKNLMRDIIMLSRWLYAYTPIDETYTLIEFQTTVEGYITMIDVNDVSSYEVSTDITDDYWDIVYLDILTRITSLKKNDFAYDYDECFVNNVIQMYNRNKIKKYTLSYFMSFFKKDPVHPL